MYRTECEIPNDIENGLLNTTEEAVSRDANVSVVCNEGYEATYSTVICLNNGSFSDPIECKSKLVINIFIT